MLCEAPWATHDDATRARFDRVRRARCFEQNERPCHREGWRVPRVVVRVGIDRAGQTLLPELLPAPGVEPGERAAVVGQNHDDTARQRQLGGALSFERAPYDAARRNV